MKKSLAILAIALVCIISCSKSNDSSGGGNSAIDCSMVSHKDFAADISPIIQASCNLSGCHNSGSFNGPGPLTNYSQIFAASSSIRAAVLSGAMPQGSSLSVAQKNSIICWIDGGAPNN